MPRPPYFGEKTPKVISFLRTISEFHKENETQLSLTTMAQRVRKVISGVKPAPTKLRKNLKTGKMEKPPDPLRHILFKLAKKHHIWFGKP